MTTQIDAGSYSADSYPAPEIGPSQPLLANAGGTGVSNDEAATLTFTGDVVLSSNVPATATLTVTAGAGVSSPVVTGPTLMSGFGTSVGSVINVKTKITFTASASTATFTVGIPSTLTAVFADTSQASGTANVLTGTSLGNLTTLASVSSARTVSFTFALGGSSGSYSVNLDFAFIVN